MELKFNTVFVLTLAIGFEMASICHCTNFRIRHIGGGKFFTTTGFNKASTWDSRVVIKDSGSNIFFMDRQYEHWGYIVHNPSGWTIHPITGRTDPSQDERVCMHPDRHSGAWWALDQFHDRIMHKGGRYLHPYNGHTSSPPEGDYVVIHSADHANMKWKFVSTDDASKEIYPYGAPKLIGEWTIFHSVLNPIAKHEKMVRVTYGRSKTLSTTTTFNFNWETTAGVDVGLFSASVTMSLGFMIETASSSTWSEETEDSIKITIVPGQSVVTWQFTFTAAQISHKSVFKSNIFADTNSTMIKPQSSNPISIS